MTSYQTHESIRDIVDRYYGFILDQYGVLHNGSASMDGATDCVQALHQMGKQLIILSNSSSPSSSTIDRLPKMGFDPSLFVGGAITSGEEATKYISKHYPKKKAIYLTWDANTQTSQEDFLRKCGNLQVTTNVEEADLVLLQGVQVMRGPNSSSSNNVEETSLGEYMATGDMTVIDPILKSCVAQNLPMVCANPDYFVVRADGNAEHMPGKVADRYRDLGGSCTSFGKPNVPHFEACIRKLNLPKDKVVHVGDSLHHDVAGANAAGVASVFVAGGVHRQELGSDFGIMPAKEKLDELFAKHKQTPTHVIPTFRM